MARKQSTGQYLRAVGYTKTDETAETLARVGVGAVIAYVLWLAYQKRSGA